MGFYELGVKWKVSQVEEKNGFLSLDIGQLYNEKETIFIIE